MFILCSDTKIRTAYGLPWFGHGLHSSLGNTAASKEHSHSAETQAENPLISRLLAQHPWIT